MKFSLEFKLKENKISCEYRKTIMYFLKRCINDANDGKYYDDFYGNSNSKNLTFSVFLKNPQFIGEKIILGSNQLKVIISILDIKYSYIFYSSFLEAKHKKVVLESDNYMVLEKVIKLSETEVYNNKLLIKMNSPLLVRKHDREKNRDWYFYFSEQEFKEELKNNLQFQLYNEGFSEQLINEIRIEPIKCKKVVVKHYGCRFAGSLGNFLLEGNPIILNYLLKAGISSRRNEGFGMAELLTDDL